MNFFARTVLVLFCLLASGWSNAHTAIAMIDKHAPETYSVVWGYETQREADQVAMKGCVAAALRNGVAKQSGKCALLHRQKGPGFGAIVCGKNICAWASGYDGKQEAVDDAYQNCSKSDTCPDTGIFAWEDAAGYPAPKRAPQKKLAACGPPPGQVVRSRTSCSNGACLRTFENGCQVQFNAPYCFDPLQGKWDWKPDGC